MESPDSYAHAKFALDVIDIGLKVAALVIGGLWALMNYNRSRIYQRKLELGLSGKVFQRNGRLYFGGTCQLKNVGQSKYPIEQNGTTCQIWAYRRSIHTELIYTFTIFERHGWIEPGEQIEEPLLTLVKFDPTELIGVRADFRVVSGGIEWNASRIFEMADNPPPRKEEGQAPAIQNKAGEHDGTT
jgi:hypothetical protein